MGDPNKQDQSVLIKLKCSEGESEVIDVRAVSEQHGCTDNVNTYCRDKLKASIEGCSVYSHSVCGLLKANLHHNTQSFEYPPTPNLTVPLQAMEKSKPAYVLYCSP